ncbi:helix-turn-helix domain-containing protein [Clostridium sp. MT-14]|jgi:DNA-binding XRE family transcriptional regulator|uniref:Helix-turn-helix transcriptional regulator n=1 Tax=Clostridium aromativorans TaxID=2836848 RepID=A0ABS8N8A5_9CLOT|nr:helix-turn-helix transcriptional regulator [Clostridium aromativorans]MCC9296049.1 helix-turn-helix transcriptional regulator [Clostridium aromativorans]CAB1248831.1 XRE family transcriptional regulator [Clostridiaceae bacterium BL-3]
MPFKKVNVREEIKKRMEEDKDFKNAYIQADREFKLIKEVVQKRKEMGISQNKIAERSGLKQQVISRIEKDGNSPTLRNFLKYLDAADLTIKIEKKNADDSANKYTTV